MIIHFIANFPHELFELDLKVNMGMLYESKKNDNRIIFDEYSRGNNR